MEQTHSTEEASGFPPSKAHGDMEHAKPVRTPVEERCMREDMEGGDSPTRPRTYSHLSQLSVEFSLAGSVPKLNTGIPQSSRPPDGGYGWCIVVATCFCSFVFIHNRISYGLFIPELTDYFGRSQTDMALVASVDSIVRCISCRYLQVTEKGRTK